MTTENKTPLPNAQTLLEFANLQVASEAFLSSKVPTEKKPPGFRTGKINLTKELNLLTVGNEHATKFTETMAKDFGDKWDVVDHIANTKTGFSGTLFVAKKQITDSAGKVIAKAGQQVISFRSTEFIEDNIHDHKMTNELEIKEKGFAFGQISDWVICTV